MAGANKKTAVEKKKVSKPMISGKKK